MKLLLAGVLAALTAIPVAAEVKQKHYVVADWQVWIDPIDPIEILFVGRNQYERDQVLSGDDVEIVAFASDEDAVSLLGLPALVVEVTGTHSCEEGDARAYYVLTFADAPALDGPVTTCKALTVSFAPDLIILEEAPGSDEGEFWAWAMGKGFGTQIP